MTNPDTRALQALADKVEAGVATMPDASACYPRDANGRMTSDKGGWHDANAMSAYHGSLDAAKALHEAVLPDIRWDISNWGTADVKSQETDEKYGHPVMYMRGFCRNDPARAWLLAIIRALIAGGRDGQA